MSGIKPARRWQPAFRPFKRERLSKRILAKTELLVKGPLFGCRMCGNCLLQETAFICPMECPKGIRNGPCGGITPEKNCYIDETRKCVWYSIYKRALKRGREETLLEVLPPLDWNKVGCETWGDVFRQIRKSGTGRFIRGLLSGKSEKRKEVWDEVFRGVRQPYWWNGDSDYHPPGYDEPASGMEKKLREGKFVIATEVTPPLGAGTTRLKRDIDLVRRHVDVINFTDSSAAHPRMSSIACCTVAAGMGAEPVLQIAARDITRCGLQSEVTGINELGIKNILCITGDSARVGPAPESSMNFVDLDSVQMLWVLRRMRDEGVYLDGRKMKKTPHFFLGAATTPFASDPVLQAIRDHKKINAGAQFFQTNLIFEPDKLDPWLEQLDKRGVLDKIYIMIGVAPLRSYRIAKYLHTKVPGVFLPERVLARLEKAGESAEEAGVEIALEIIESVRGKKGVNGIHLMSMGWESVVERILAESGLCRK